MTGEVISLFDQPQPAPAGPRALAAATTTG